MEIRNDYKRNKVNYIRTRHTGFYKNRFNPIPINETKCLQCNKCIEHSYHRILRNGKHFAFKYCEGNKRCIYLSKWYPKGSDYKYYAHSLADIEGRKVAFHNLFKEDHTLVIDHIDGDSLNNMLKNLRECSNSENMRNRREYKWFGESEI